MMYWNQGEMTVLHVPLDKPLSHDEQQAMRVVLQSWGWDHPDTEEPYPYYVEVVEGYILDQSMTKKSLREVFQPNDPVESYVSTLETYDDITTSLRNACGREDILVARCKVAYVSLE